MKNVPCSLNTTVAWICFLNELLLLLLIKCMVFDQDKEDTITFTRIFLTQKGKITENSIMNKLKLILKDALFLQSINFLSFYVFLHVVS